ncbi:MAG TPA: hypothetical protein VF880_18535 [Actinomycetes bacterium]
MRSRTGLVGLVILVLAAAAGCDANKPNRAGAPTSTQAGHPADHMATPTTLLPADASPQQRRAEFEQLLGLHALVAVRVMRALAVQMERDGYQQMLGVANTLVAAIQKTVKPQLPVGGSQTGLGGTAHRRR